VENEIFDVLSNSTNIEYSTHSGWRYNSHSNVSFSDIEHDVNPNITYKERHEMLIEKLDDQVRQLNKEITVIESEILRLEHCSFLELLYLDYKKVSKLI